MQLIRIGVASEHSLGHADAHRGAIRLTRLGYYIAKDPHLVRGVIGASAH